MKFTSRKAAFIMACLLWTSSAVIATPTTTNSTPVEREVQQLVKQSRKAIEAIEGDFENKDKAVQQKAFKKYQEIEKEYAGKLMAVSKKDPKDPGTIDALTMILYLDRDSDSAKEAFKKLSHDYLASPHIAMFCFYLEHYYDPNDRQAGAKLLKQIVDTNPDTESKAAALLCLGRATKRNPAVAEKYFTEVIEKYPNIKLDLFGRKMDFAKDAKNELFEIQHLSIGKPAPDITGEDIDGKKFSLSDYRGKVVLLDFWGDW
jgi:tetratricopeptide (TPR) repeat protein